MANGNSTNKLDSVYTIRIPKKLKDLMENLGEKQKHEMAEQIRLVIAKHVHDALFNPEDYLSGE